MPMTMACTDETMVEARGLARTFETRGAVVHAVAGIDLTIASGEIVGLLGPNGAGKSTTQRMLVTLLEATGGNAVVAGHDLRRDPKGVRRRIGYVAQGGSTDPRALVDEELVLQGRLYGLSRHEAERRADEMRARFDLTDIGRRQVRTLSGGQRRRLEVALGLVHRPPLLFLDEPSTGLDPHSRANLWRHIRSLRAETKTTVFLTTHYLDEADASCDRIFIMDHGRIVAEGTPEELKRRIAGDLVTFNVGPEMERARALLASQPGVRQVVPWEGTVRVTVGRGEESVLPLMRAFDFAGIAVASMQIARPTLDDVFLTLTGRSLHDAPNGSRGAPPLAALAGDTPPSRSA
jgi:ABC-2 type transport system ATP-binding protein